MKKEELLEIGLTDEQADKVFALNGKDVEKYKSQAAEGPLSNRKHSTWFAKR